MTATDCGPACLAMVLAYHGKRLPLEEVRASVGAGRRGADAERLRQAAEWFGLRGRGVRVDELSDLSKLPPGTILHWRFNHFVVFERLTRRGAVIVDPGAGRREISKQELDGSFTGVALTFEPSPEFAPGGRKNTGVGRYFRKIVRRSALLPRLIATTALLQALGLALPLLTGLIVDRVVPRGDFDLLALLGTGLGIVVALNFAGSILRAHLLLYLRTRLDSELTLEFLDHLVSLPYSFFQQRSSGDLMMRLNSNATVREIVTSGTLSGLLDGTLVSLYLVLLMTIHWQMGLLVLFLGVLRIALFLLTRRRYQALLSESLAVQAKSRSYQVEILAGIETLKAVGAERRAVEEWSDLFVDELNVSLARGRLGALFDSLLGALGLASPFMILLFGSLGVLRGELSLGTMLAASALASGFLMPLSALVGTALQFQLMGSYLERIDDVLGAAPEQDRQLVARTPRLRGGIQLESVSFRHDPALPEVVVEVSLDIVPGQFVAIVGASGAGKTTLANLLLGLYQPTAGTILYDGLELERLDWRSLRSQLGMVTQQPYLFGSSIRKNIALADPTLPLFRIVEAAKAAQIHGDIVAMPMAYETVLADAGASLSGGQRQRLALARALVHRPAILLLDEATSNLDAVTEQRIQQELSRLECTRVVIAHRLSTVQNADLILLMDQGRIIESGTHEGLLSKNGRYCELFAAQIPSHTAGPQHRQAPSPSLRLAEGV